MKNNSLHTGYIYILVSPTSNCIKIGGTDYPPLKRIKEINTTEPYKSLGPWSLADFRQVENWREVESSLHYIFRSKLNTQIAKQKELFHLPVSEAQKHLNSLDPSIIVKKPKVDRMFQDNFFAEYAIQLFKFTGLLNWLDIQGAWTFVLFPSTNGGRYFTINIGSHEVAFSTLPKKHKPSVHMILMDKLILDFSAAAKWVYRHNGDIIEESYASALPRSTSILFEGTFEHANEFLKIDGVRRALIAYWNEALIGLKERNALSIFSRYHNWNAVAEINSRINIKN